MGNLARILTGALEAAGGHTFSPAVGRGLTWLCRQVGEGLFSEELHGLRRSDSQLPV